MGITLHRKLRNRLTWVNVCPLPLFSISLYNVEIRRRALWCLSRRATFWCHRCTKSALFENSSTAVDRCTRGHLLRSRHHLTLICTTLSLWYETFCHTLDRRLVLLLFFVFVKFSWGRRFLFALNLVDYFRKARINFINCFIRLFWCSSIRLPLSFSHGLDFFAFIS